MGNNVMKPRMNLINVVKNNVQIITPDDMSYQGVQTTKSTKRTAMPSFLTSLPESSRPKSL
jgi:hypothetical protein